LAVGPEYGKYWNRFFFFFGKKAENNLAPRARSASVRAGTDREMRIVLGLPRMRSPSAPAAAAPEEEVGVVRPTVAAEGKRIHRTMFAEVKLADRGDDWLGEDGIEREGREGGF
jgi:hypothetical protein